MFCFERLVSILYRRSMWMTCHSDAHVKLLPFNRELYSNNHCFLSYNANQLFSPAMRWAKLKIFLTCNHNPIPPLNPCIFYTHSQQSHFFSIKETSSLPLSCFTVSAMKNVPFWRWKRYVLKVITISIWSVIKCCNSCCEEFFKESIAKCMWKRGYKDKGRVCRMK